MKRIYLFSLCFVLIISFGIFIYPGLYKYDKFNQKTLVKINRITGNTQILYADGWRTVNNNAQVDNAEKSNKDVDAIIDEKIEKLKEEMLNAIKSELQLANQDNITNDDYGEINFDSIRNRNKNADVVSSPNESSDFFEKGDSPDRVQEVMGTPDGIIGGELHEIWKYGNSSVTFSNGTVNGWSNRDNNLKLK
ncbi:hypothetical protein [Paenibacillus motobuensis]|uniref:Uncharacterized protein n=1 Tax=Paenibacillus motobuensis TaxID=295324 RepID=A0ABN0Y4C1_9BACL